MKKQFILIALLIGTIFTASASYALTISDGTDVGSADIWLAETQQLSGEAAELAWVRSILGNSIEFIIKHDDLEESDWQRTNQTGTWALALNNDPSYFLIKTGTIDGTNNKEFLFENTGSLAWAVLDLDSIHVTDVLNIGKVSHVNEYTPVPEPSTVLLLGAGILGLILHGRRRYSKQ